MSIAICCAQCDWKGNVKVELAGKKGKCPTCGEPITVPNSGAEPDDVEAAAAAALMDGDDASPSPRAPTYMPPAYTLERSEPKPQQQAAPKSYGMKFEYKAKEQQTKPGGSGLHPGVVMGLLMMGGATIWFFVALGAGWIFFYPPILFVLGLVRFVYGLAGRDDV
jgi:hypothetical protein